NAYAFAYDQLYRLTNSDFGTLAGTSAYSFSVASLNKHKETIGGYDKNGNITSLQRRDKDGTLMGDYNYIYHTASNKVDKINNGSSLLVDYTYNAIGQMTQQAEGGKIMNVAYDAYGLVKSIKNGSNQLLQEY